MSRYKPYPAYKDSGEEWLGISRKVLHGQSARYGEEILPTLSAKLVSDYGKGFGARNPARRIWFAPICSRRDPYRSGDTRNELKLAPLVYDRLHWVIAHAREQTTVLARKGPGGQKS